MIVKFNKSGYITIPEKYIQELDLKENDDVEIDIRFNEIVIKKTFHSCVFCRSVIGLVTLGNLCACRICINRLNKANDGDYLYTILHE